MRALCLCGALLLPGCVRVFAIGAKVFMGDPKVTSTFEQRQHVELQKGKDRVAVVIDAPHQLTDEYDTLLSDLQVELHYQLRRHGVDAIDPSEVDQALEATGGGFAPTRLGEALDAAYIMHVQVQRFTTSATGDPNLLQCRSSGVVQGYAVRGTQGEADRHVVKVYEEPFQTGSEAGHPVPADQTSRREFLQQSIRELTQSIGRHMYDVPTSSLY